MTTTFKEYMKLQIRTILVSGLPADKWVAENAASFRARFIVR